MNISLITATYNSAATLRDTIQSVISQTFHDIEYIIVDGGSTDTTVEIIKEYEPVFQGRMRWVSEPDNGIYDAMNKGLRMATGDYICFLNAGDFFPTPHTLDTIVEKSCLESVASTQWPAVIYGNTDIVDSHGHFLRHRRLTPPKKLSWRSFRKGMLVCHQAFYARTDIARHTPYDTRYRFSADVDWCIRVMKEAKRRELQLRYVEDVVANYTMEGQTTLHHKESLRERFDVMRSHYGIVVTIVMHLWFVVRQIIKK